MYSRPRPSATPAQRPCAQNRVRLDISSARPERVEGRTVFALEPLPFACTEVAKLQPNVRSFTRAMSSLLRVH